jgi:cation:H+ antiporter
MLLILGVAGLAMPIKVPFDTIRRDGLFMLAASVLVAGLLFGGMARWEGALSVALLIGYIVFVYRKERRVFDASGRMLRRGAEAVEPVPTKLWLALVMAVAGLLLTVLGAHFLVRGAVMFARDHQVPESIIGLSIIAIGTSLPELVTSIVAALRRQADVAFGNVVGSNIYNMLGILGVTALAKPIDVPARILQIDIWVMLAISILILLFSYTGRSISRREALALLGLYVVYLGWLTL